MQCYLLLLPWTHSRLPFVSRIRWKKNATIVKPPSEDSLLSLISLLFLPSRAGDSSQTWKWSGDTFLCGSFLRIISALKYNSRACLEACDLPKHNENETFVAWRSVCHYNHQRGILFHASADTNKGLALIPLVFVALRPILLFPLLTRGVVKGSF